MIVQLNTSDSGFDFHRVEAGAPRDYLKRALLSMSEPPYVTEGRKKDMRRIEEERRALKLLITPLPFVFLAGFFSGTAAMLLLQA